LWALTRNLTAAAGLPAYEVSNHARPGEESRHNLAYWRYRDYLGVGPGAHGRRHASATLRHKKPGDTVAAVARSGHGIAEETGLAPATQASEALLMGLRLSEGVDLADIGARFGFAPAELIDARKLPLHLRLGLVRQEGSRLIVTPAGMPLLDALLADLVSEALVSA
jgi:oxygen-independent coproporphyrinogen-3 oxidase